MIMSMLCCLAVCVSSDTFLCNPFMLNCSMCSVLFGGSGECWFCCGVGGCGVGGCGVSGCGVSGCGVSGCGVSGCGVSGCGVGGCGVSGCGGVGLC